MASTTGMVIMAPAIAAINIMYRAVTLSVSVVGINNISAPQARPLANDNKV